MMDTIKNNNQIAILLSTYNGEKYLKEQIYSIVKQDYRDWNLYVRDDGSKDTTLSLLYKIKEEDSRIHIITDEIKHRGILNSYMYLLNHIESKYYMFCDQDDFWLPNKISESLFMVKTAEKNLCNDIPILVCTDLFVVDDSLNTIHSSLWEQNHVQKLLSNISKSICIAPLFPGCTMLFNKRAREECININPHPKAIHDNHLALSIVSKKGLILPLRKSLIKYRQHSNNVLGAYRGKHFILNKLTNLIKVVKQNYSQYTIAKYYLNVSIYKFTILKIKHLFQYI